MDTEIIAAAQLQLHRQIKDAIEVIANGAGAADTIHQLSESIRCIEAIDSYVRNYHDEID